MLKLSILDQSPVSEGTTPASAIRQTLSLAAAAETFGYHRYWVSEHHNTNSFASASPEILLGRIASLTQRIRIGSAGVLLTLYSPLKIAEQFNMLETLFPGRIDLGIGRAGGSDAKTLKALHPDAQSEDTFAKFDDMISFMDNNVPGPLHFRNVNASPLIENTPQFWVLGSSPASAEYAATRGLPYSFANFINAEYCIPALQTYHQHFRPSRFLKAPYVNLAVFALCADSEKEANRLAKSSELWVVKSFLRRENVKFPDQATAESVSYHPQERLVLAYRRKSSYIGSAGQVSAALAETAKQLAVNELTIVTITPEYEDRLRSYELLADAFELTPSFVAQSEES